MIIVSVRSISFAVTVHVISTSAVVPRIVALYLHSFFLCRGCFLTVNDYIGFGLIDAGAMVDAAHNWVTVPEKFSCSIKPQDSQR